VTNRQYVYDGGVPSGVRLFLNAALGLGAGDADIRKISFLNICRLADDAIQVSHSHLDAYVSFAVQTADA
jgi:hypothetical protein